MIFLRNLAAASSRVVSLVIVLSAATATAEPVLDLRTLPLNISGLRFGNVLMNYDKSVRWTFNGQPIDVWFPNRTALMTRSPPDSCAGFIVANLACKGPAIGEGQCTFINNNYDNRQACSGCGLLIKSPRWSGWYQVPCSSSHY